ncbi:CHAT domain-containing protein [Trichoderma austrokoningii]
MDYIENFIDETLTNANEAPSDSGLAILYNLGEYLVGISESTREISYLQGATEFTLRSFEEYWFERLRTHAFQTVEKCIHAKEPVLEDIEEAICALRALRTVQGLIAIVTLDCSSYASSTYNLGKLLYYRFLETRDMADLDKVIAISRSIMEVPIIGHLERQAFSLRLMIYLWKRYDLTEEMADREEALCFGQNFINIAPPNHPKRGMGFSCAASCLYRRYSITEDFRDLNEAISSAQEAADNGTLTGLADSVWTRYLFSDYLRKRYESSRETTDLEEAIYMNFEAAEACSTDDQRWIYLLGILACLLLMRYDYTKTLADFDDAVNLLREAITTLTIDHPQRYLFLAQFRDFLNERYQRSETGVDLEEVICASRETLDASSWNFEASAALANSLHYRFQRSGALANALEHLGRFFSNRHKQTGALTDIDNVASLDPMLRIITFINLGISLSDLEESIFLTRKVIESMATLQEDISAYDYMDNALYNLGLFLQARFVRTGRIEDLNEIISLLQKAFDTVYDSLSYQERSYKLFIFSTALFHRFRHLGEMADLMEAILIAREAANMIPKDDLKRNYVLRFLGNSLSERFIHTRANSDLDDAICVFQDALHTISPSHPDRARFLAKLDSEYFYTEVEAEALADIENAQECFIDALYLETAVPEIRFLAGRGALFSPGFIDYQKAYEVAKSTIDLVPLLAPCSLQNSDKQSNLSSVAGVSSIAAAIALQKLPIDQRTLAAIECLETGRGLIGGAHFQQYEVLALQKHYPDLAQSFFTLRDQLDKPNLEGIGFLNNSHAVDVEENERRKTEQQFTELLEIIRSKKDFQRFLLPASEIDMLHAAACGGPIVILNMSRYRCDALIIGHSGLRFLELPHLSQGASSESLIYQRYRDLQSLKTLSWLWDDIPPTDDSWPHVWWIPTNGLTKFPLHAAGHHLRRSGESTLDRAIIHSRQRGTSRIAEPLNLTAVAMGETNEHVPLVHAVHEVDSILNILESNTISCHQPPPYKCDVLSSIKSCQIFHFAGHGETHPTDPLQSKLLLKDWQKTNLASNPPFLAYLSACGTGQVLDDRFENESIHLSSAFQLAGFLHVIGTLWSVDDELSVEIAEMTYKTLRGGMRDDLVSRGLHDAIRTLRDRWVDRANGGATNESRIGGTGLRESRHAQLDDDEEPGNPLWIPYVHFGV